MAGKAATVVMTDDLSPINPVARTFCPMILVTTLPIGESRAAEEALAKRL